MDLENVHKLVTREDPLHIHKTLGIVCLGNFFYRFYLLFAYGTMFLETPSGIASVTLHGILSLSSLVFHLPDNRINGKPMIYPEMRVHTIVFTLRSVACCLTYYFSMSQYLRMCIIFSTMLSADIVTFIFNRGNTNGTTIRNMPYDPLVTEETKQSVKLMNSNMQIAATLFMLGNIESAFCPLFAIQMAALLSTLVRKSIISGNMWHILYSISLWINIALYYQSLPFRYIIIQFISYMIYTRVFFLHRTNKYMNWSIICILFLLYEKIQIPIIPYEEYIRCILILRFIYSQMYKVRGLFLHNQ